MWEVVLAHTPTSSGCSTLPVGRPLTANRFLRRPPAADNLPVKPKVNVANTIVPLIVSADRASKFVSFSACHPIALKSHLNFLAQRSSYNVRGGQDHAQLR
jgi:hypothetical protein